MSPGASKAEAENAAHLSVALVENAIVILMLVEDHLRLQSKLWRATWPVDGTVSPLSVVAPMGNRLVSDSSSARGSLEMGFDRRSSSSDSRGLPLDVCG